MRTIGLLAAAALCLTACTAKESGTADTSKTAAGTATADADKNPAGGGTLPSGYAARTDKPDASIGGAKYSSSGNQWEVRTGPAHIMYDPKTMGNGNYTASAKIEQLEKPAHPEAYGLFVGGRDLDKPSESYTYFIVRGTGELAVKVREGSTVRDVIPWTASTDVPKEDASGKATYALTVQVTNDAVKFSVNGKEVASVGKAGLPLDGTAGLRINHNLHVRVNPVSVTAP